MKHALVFLAVMALALPAYADVTNWTGTADHSDWFNPGNWNNGVPDSGEPVNAYIENGDTVKIENGDASAGSWGNGVYVASSIGNATLEIGTGGNLNSDLYLSHDGGTSTVIIKDGGIYRCAAYLHLNSVDGATSKVELYDGSEIKDIGYIHVGQGAGSGSAELVQYGGAIYARSDYPLRIGVSGGSGTYTMHAGSLNVYRVMMGKYSSGGTCTWNITSTDVDITITDKDDGGQGSKFEIHGGYDQFLSAPEGAPGETVLIKMHSSKHVNYWNGSGGKDAQLAGLNNITMQYEGTFAYGATDPNTHEVAGADLGCEMAGLTNNFALEGLTLGGLEGVASLKLTDDSDNMGDGAGNDALYVENLDIGTGSLLDLAGSWLYYLNGDAYSIGDGKVIDGVGGGGICQIPEPASLVLLGLGGLALIRRRRR